MRRIHIGPTFLLIVPLLIGACGESADSTSDMIGSAEREASPSVSAGAQQLTATGSLIEVDPEERTLTVRMASAAGAEEVEFSYDAATQVLGADGQAQALTGQDGSPVTVSYRQEGATRHAVRVQISPAAAANPAGAPGTPAASEAAPSAPVPPGAR